MTRAPDAGAPAQTAAGGPAETAAVGEVRGHASGFWRDLGAIAGRALRQMRREPVTFLPAIFVPCFFYLANLGALGHVASQSGLDYKDFLLPMAIAFAVTGVSRAPNLVTDIQSGYFDRLCLTPVRRLALLLGLMVADMFIAVVLAVLVLALGLAVGVRFSTGGGGMLVFIALSALWGLVFTGFPYAVALKTGSPGAVNATFVLFFPFAFLTDAIIPKQSLTTWFSTIATYNPVTYLLGAQRSVILGGWQARPLLEGFAALAGLGIVSMTTALLALRGRIRRG